MRGRAGGGYKRVQLFAGEAVAHDGILAGSNLVCGIKPQLDELRGKQVGHTRRPLDIANRGNSAAEHFERRAAVRVGRVPAFALRLEHDIGIALLGKIGMHKPTRTCAVLGSRNDTIVALVNQVLKLNAALFERTTDGTRAVLRGLLVLAKGEQQRALVLPTMRQRILNRLENARDLVFHVNGAATPNVGVVHVTAKGSVRPVGLSARHHGDHVHVAHEHDRLEGGVGAGKRHEQRMVDELDLARRKHARPGLLHIGGGPFATFACIICR